MSDKQPIEVISDALDLSYLVKTGTRLVVNFHAPWAAPCAQMNLVFAELHASQPPSSPIRFATAAAEALPDLTAKYDVSTVPTFLLFADTRLVRRRSGADPAGLASDVSWLRSASPSALQDAACDAVARLGEITVLMKGTPDAPRCGFSRQVVELLRAQGVVFRHFDVLQDEEVRAWMKKRVDWATYPMVFARGRLIGGLDILRELRDAGTLVEELAADGAGEKPRAPEKEGKGLEGAGATGVEGSVGQQEQDALKERLTALTTREKVMVFMKGEPEAPRCGFSRKMVELLNGEKVEFGHFDILTDPAVRAGLKTFSDWPTFPQVYANGRFIGGLDVITELRDAGELATEIGLEAA